MIVLIFVKIVAMKPEVGEKTSDKDAPEEQDPKSISINRRIFIYQFTDIY